MHPRCIAGLVFLSIASCHEAVTAPPAAAPKPPAPIVPVASVIVAVSAVLQTAAPLTAVGSPPSVIVRDQFGIAMPLVAVRFAVRGGRVDIASVSTDTDGVATCGRWVLDSIPGVNIIEARVDGSTAVAPVVFTAIGVSTATDGATYSL
ncbi:MAG: hypothetical protein ACHQQ3_13980, partial [Gemmatimonadales bacterium]